MKQLKLRGAAMTRKTLSMEIQKRIAALEKEIADLEAKERDYAAELEKPETYHSGGRATQINRELVHVSDRLEAANTEWEKAGAELAGLEASLAAE